MGSCNSGNNTFIKNVIYIPNISICRKTHSKCWDFWNYFYISKGTSALPNGAIFAGYFFITPALIHTQAGDVVMLGQETTLATAVVLVLITAPLLEILMDKGLNRFIFQWTSKVDKELSKESKLAVKNNPTKNLSKTNEENKALLKHLFQN